MANAINSAKGNVTATGTRAAAVAQSLPNVQPKKNIPRLVMDGTTRLTALRTNDATYRASTSFEELESDWLDSTSNIAQSAEKRNWVHAYILGDAMQAPDTNVIAADLRNLVNSYRD